MNRRTLPVAILTLLLILLISGCLTILPVTEAPPSGAVPPAVDISDLEAIMDDLSLLMACSAETGTLPADEHLQYTAQVEEDGTLILTVFCENYCSPQTEISYEGSCEMAMGLDGCGALSSMDMSISIIAQGHALSESIEFDLDALYLTTLDHYEVQCCYVNGVSFDHGAVEELLRGMGSAAEW
ncbi:MAG: hypothetical protein K9M84_10595 [Spirochaetia bacterium]|nr:hypothetical protein [Spirochaetia bacterium]